jgi:hypothetical protein
MSMDNCQVCEKRLDTDYIEYQEDGTLLCDGCLDELEIEKWIADHWWCIVHEDDECDCSNGFVSTDDLRALLAGKVLCEKEPVAIWKKGSNFVVPALNDSIEGYGSNWTYLYAPASLAGNASIGKQAQQPDYKALYHELVYQVATVVPGESRYQTALRYIREREDRCNAQEVGESTNIGKEGGE